MNLSGRGRRGPNYWPKEGQTWSTVFPGVQLLISNTTRYHDYIHRYLLEPPTLSSHLLVRVMRILVVKRDQRREYAVDHLELTKWSETNTAIITRVFNQLRTAHCIDNIPFMRIQLQLVY